MQGQYMFSGWLGQYSKSAKGQRLLRELQQRLRLKITGNKQEVRLDYIPIIVQKLFSSLSNEIPGIPGAIELLDDYYLTRDDFESLMDLGYQDAYKELPTKTKSSFTRLYNSSSHITPFDLAAGKMKTRVGDSKGSGEILPDNEDILVEDEIVAESDSNEDDVAIEKPAKKAPKKASNSKKASSSSKK